MPKRDAASLGERLSVSVSSEHRRRLQVIAKMTEHSEAWLVRRAIRMLIDTHKQNPAQLELALRGDNQKEN